MKTFDIFPTKIFIESEAYLNRTEELLNVNVSKDPSSVSTRLGTQTVKNIHTLDIKPINELVSDLESKISNLIDSKLKVTTMWYNICPTGAFNHSHIHGGSDYSGIIYLHCTKDTGSLVFTDPRCGAEMSTFSDNPVQITPKNGDLIIFPSWLKHHTEVNLDSLPKISISFNYSVF
jgi:uncharacterized protein (TIGR02466 family)